MLFLRYLYLAVEYAHFAAIQEFEVYFFYYLLNNKAKNYNKFSVGFTLVCCKAFCVDLSLLFALLCSDLCKCRVLILANYNIFTRDII